jgi:hypothetical protein
VADIPSGLSLTPPQVNKKKLTQLVPMLLVCVGGGGGIKPRRWRKLSELDTSLNFLIKNSGASVRQRTIPTERLPLVGEVSVNFSG